jgi:hypothetical protein
MHAERPNNATRRNLSRQSRSLAQRLRDTAVALGLATTLSGAAVLATAAPFSFTASPAAATVDDSLPSGSALVRAAVERMGGRGWRTIESFESVATARTPMGDARVEYQFVAPDAHRVVQGMPGGAGAMEMGAVGGVAWIGEPGKAPQAADPRMAQELAGGGDLQSVVRGLEERFTDFRTVARVKLDPATGAESADGRLAWRIAMTPRQGGAGAKPWEILVDAASGFLAGIEIPAPGDEVLSTLPPDAPKPTGQSIRLARWEAVERGGVRSQAADPAVRLMAFREASVTAGGMRTELVYSKVAVDTLARGAIRVPESLARSAAAR